MRHFVLRQSRGEGTRLSALRIPGILVPVQAQSTASIADTRYHHRAVPGPC